MSDTNKPWLKHYPKNVPAEIDPRAYPSLVAALDASCKKYAERNAFENMGQILTYADLDRLTAQLGAYFQHDLGLNKGDRIALMMPNLLQYPVCIFAALRAGLTVVNTNPLYTERELKHQLKDSGARAIIALENFASTLEAVLPDVDIEHIILTRLGDMLPFPKGLITNWVVKHVKKMVPTHDIQATAFKQALNTRRANELTPASLTLDDLAFLQYTGGTTGVAKGAELTHGNMVANLEQSGAWLTDEVSDETQEVIITALPLYHIFALTVNCMVFIRIGGFNRLITNPRDMPGFVKELQKGPFTSFTGVNTLFNGLLNTPGFDQIDFSQLKLSLGGGMAVQQAVAERWQEVTGSALVEGYGLTETSPGAIMNLNSSDHYTGHIGYPLPSTEACVMNEEGIQQPPNEPGEICIRGPQVMRGYWQRPEETAKVITEDGWLRTGDIAIMTEDGAFKIVDRKKDMILVSGFNVYPNEIEDVAVKHPDVVEVAAIGIPDDKSGEVVKLVAVASNPELDEKTLKEFCRQDLTGYKVPKTIQFVDELPKTNVGKILRREVRDLYGAN